MAEESVTDVSMLEEVVWVDGVVGLGHTRKLAEAAAAEEEEVPQPPPQQRQEEEEEEEREEAEEKG